MRFRLLSAVVAALSLVTTSCSENDPTGPLSSSMTPRMDLAASALTQPAVRISEFHYDNVSTDSGERVEISYPTGTSLVGYSLLYVNGSGGAIYATTALTGGVTATCGDRGVAVFNGPSAGIQNGEPDGIALVQGTTIVQFLSYEGVTVGTAGVVNGAKGRDIGVSQATPSVVGGSLQMDADGTWYATSLNTFGACNDNVTAPGNVVTSVTISPSSPSAQPGSTVTLDATASASGTVLHGAFIKWTSTNAGVATIDVNGSATALTPGVTQIIATAGSGKADTVTLAVFNPGDMPDTRFSELHYDNFGSDINEAIEIEGPAGTDLTGWSVVLYNGNGGGVYDTRTLTGSIPSMCSARGVVLLYYDTDGIQNGSPDGLALVDGAGEVVEFLSYEGSFTATNGPAQGMTSQNIGASQTSTPIGQSLSRNAAGIWEAPAAATLGACNSGEGPAAPPAPNAITITGRDGNAPLPVGFEDQLFASLRSGTTGSTIPTTFTWTSETPAIATIDQDGVMHALSAGDAVFRATATDGSTRTYSLEMYVATAGDAVYQNHVEFGVPTDSNPADDFIINRTEYQSSFSVERGIPNWVSYNLDETHFGAEDRCDCFTFDPELPQDGRYTTADYTGAGAFHGYGIDRGHLARSFDRTSGSLDNARTFYFSNIFPQAADFNQGTWGLLETDLGNLARLGQKELFIITGVSGTLGTVKNEGLITIPAYAWKVAVVLDRNEGLASVDSYDDLEVIAVVMPNDSLVAGPWQNYSVTVDSVEKLSGYDLLALLPDYIEIAVESGAVDAFALIQQLVASGAIKAGVGTSLSAKLDAAIASLAAGNSTAAANQLNALLNEIQALERSGRLSPTNANALRDALAGIIAAAST